MKIAIVGSREFRDLNLIDTKLMQEFKNYPHNPNVDILNTQIKIVSGGAKGVDSYAEEFAKHWCIEAIIFKPEWNKYGKSAGFIRNELIVNEADKVVAFWDGSSRGTKNSIDLAIKAKKPIDIYIRH